MKRIKLVIKMITSIFLICAFTTGCWNYVEIEKKGVVMGAAVDYDTENNLFIITAELSSPQTKAGETKVAAECVSGKGRSFIDAARNIVSTTGRKLLWSHAKVIILSEAVVKKKEILISVLDFLKRDAEPRDDIYLVLSREKTAQELFVNVKSSIDKINSLYYEQTLNNQTSVCKFPKVFLWSFLKEVSSKGISPVLPTVKLYTEKDATLGKMYGTGIFKGSRFMGYLEEEETKYFLMVKDEFKGGVIPISNQDAPYESITLEVLKSDIQRKPVYQNDQLGMKVNISLTVSLAEIGSTVDYVKKDKMNQLKEDAQRFIKDNVKETIRKLQNEYDSDIFGFGNVIEREMPDLWKKLEPSWEKAFLNLKVDVNVKLNIRGSMLRSKTIEIGE